MFISVSYNIKCSFVVSLKLESPPNPVFFPQHCIGYFLTPCMYI